jgi:excinuclease ABC subunit C
MHLRHPAFVRFLGSNPYPRITVTHRPSLREADWAYGPFPSRAAAERYAEEMLKLFLLRRCTFELAPDPSYPGCVYSEMKMCLAPCFKGCTDERYSEESAAVESFLATRGESRLVTLRAERDQASANLAFESAAALHVQAQRVEAVHALAAEIVRPLSKLRGLILQASANPDEVAVFLFESGRLRGPAAFSTLGMRIQNEQSGSTSLFAQPLAVEPIPEEVEVQGTEEQGVEERESGISGSLTAEKQVEAHESHASAAPKLARGVLESRLEAALATLAQEGSAPATAPPSTVRQGHLALLKRWYYRPEAKRTGEIFFPDSENRWPFKAVLRGVGRIAAEKLRSSAS